MKTAFKACAAFFKREAVLCAAGILALISAFFVPPSIAYIEYIDTRVLALLFCLMLVVSGLKSIGVFQSLGMRLLSGIKNTRSLVLIITWLCFFSSMLITNDVSLITFVPFGIMVLSMADQKSLLIPVIVLQTIAANLGSMFTPIGNPQNLYLYSYFSIPVSKFLLSMLPLTILSFILITTAVFLIPNSDLCIENIEKPHGIEKKRLFAYIFMFLICLACVAHAISFISMLIIVAAGVFIVDRRLFKQIDYYLLLTFVFFFLFIGNAERIPAVAEFLSRFIQNKELLLGILLSQCISNVPAAILLSGFTNQSIPLLYGVNIGGLGTLIASLASLISYRAYTNIKGAQKKRYLIIFTIYNLVFLIVASFAGSLILKYLL